jgi:hypothetical protein
MSSKYEFYTFAKLVKALLKKNPLGEADGHGSRRQGVGGRGTPLATHKKKIPAKTGIFQQRRNAIIARS